MLFSSLRFVLKLFDIKLYKNENGTFVESTEMAGIMLTSRPIVTLYKVEKKKRFFTLKEIDVTEYSTNISWWYN